MSQTRIIVLRSYLEQGKLQIHLSGYCNTVIISIESEFYVTLALRFEPPWLCHCKTRMFMKYVITLPYYYSNYHSLLLALKQYSLYLALLASTFKMKKSVMWGSVFCNKTDPIFALLASTSKIVQSVV